MKFKFFITAIVFFIFAIILFISSIILKTNNVVEPDVNSYIDIAGWTLFGIGWIFNIIALLKK